MGREPSATIPCRYDYCYPHFADEKVEEQKGQIVLRVTQTGNSRCGAEETKENRECWP